jgi:hypothetical protein
MRRTGSTVGRGPRRWIPQLSKGKQATLRQIYQVILIAGKR